MFGVVLVGAWTSALILFPYWLFGRYSAIGWYDEYDFTIPGYLAVALSPSPDTFLPRYAGGTSVGALLLYGNDAVSFYAALIRAFGAQVASLIFRFLGFLMLYLGTYFTAYLLFAMRHRAAIVGGLTAMVFTVYPYAWTLGGYAWNLSILPWVGLLMFADMSLWRRSLLAVALGVVTIATASIFFFLPWLAAYLLLLWALRPLPIRELWSRAALAAFVYATIVAVVELSPALNLARSFSELARFMNLRDLAAFQAYFNPEQGRAGMEPVAAYAAAIGDFKSFAFPGLDFLRTGNIDTLMGFPLTILFLIGAIGTALWLARVRQQTRPLLGLLGFLAVIFVLTFIARVVKVPVFSTFRWDTVYVVLTPTIALLWGMMIEECSYARGYFARWWPLAICALVALVSSSSLAQRSLASIDAYGGWAAFSDYPALRDLDRREPFTRAVSFPQYYPNPVVGIFNGLATLDGARRFTWRRTAFWFLTLKTPPQAEWQPDRQTLGRDLLENRVDALAMANVSYLLSTSEMPSGRLRLQTKELGLKLSDVPMLRLFTRMLPGFTLLPPVYIYDLGVEPWPRVFAPRTVGRAPAPDTDAAYYLRLRDISPRGLLAPANAPQWLQVGDAGGLAVDHVEETWSGVAISTNGAAGLLVYNQEFTSAWKAYCDNREIAIAPVNGIMMAVSVPTGCKRVVFAVGHGAPTAVGELN